MSSNEFRALTKEEYELSRWLLENGGTEAQSYLPQLEIADATEWKCPCGCASFNLRVRGKAEPPPGVHVLGDFLFGNENNLSGVFVYSSEGILSGVEVYGLAGDAPNFLPSPHELRPFEAGGQKCLTKRFCRTIFPALCASKIAAERGVRIYDQVTCRYRIFNPLPLRERTVM